MRLAEIDLVDSPLVLDAMDLARAHSETWLFNHVMRSWLFGVCIAQKTGLNVDPELLAVATVLHDLGLTTKFSGPERFEIDGANAAREFLGGRGLGPQDVQLVWDAIALHTTRSIALHKGAEVALCQSGIAADILGLSLDLIAPKQVAAVLVAYPRLSMKTELETCLCKVVREKPDTTYDNFLREMGDRYISGYAPPSFADYLRLAPFED